MRGICIIAVFENYVDWFEGNTGRAANCFRKSRGGLGGPWKSVSIAKPVDEEAKITPTSATGTRKNHLLFRHKTTE